MGNKVSFEKLLEPYYIGKVKTRNRMIKTAAGTGFFTQDEFHQSRKALAFYEALARGGVGLIIVESPIIDYSPNAAMFDMFRLDEDKFIPVVRELTTVIHKYECPAFLQMYHPGPFSPPVPVPFPVKPIAASAVKIDSIMDNHNILPRSLTIPEIKEKVDRFASAAVRAYKAGFDGVEINAGSSHLLATFLSRFWNKRQDIYGCQSLENRARILVEIIQEIKKRIGQDFPVSVLFNGIEVDAIGMEVQDQCMTTLESRKLAQIFQEAGADAFQIRAHWLGNHIGGFLPETLFYPEPCRPLDSFPREFDSSQNGKGATVPVAAAVKKAVSKPVITVGKLDPELGKKILEQNKADFIGLNRRLCADPELPNKITSGKLDDVAPCTSCSTCLSSVGIPMHCRVNAACGTDDLYVIKPAEKRKKVLVIGGGPSGMEVARVSALRGHQVVLFDKSQNLGGLIPVAALVKGTQIEDLPALVRYLSGQIAKLGVDIKLGKEVTPSMIEKIKPDVIIVAAGGVIKEPDIPGIDRRNVVSKKDLYSSLTFYLRIFGPDILRWLTRFWMPLGKTVVIIGGDIQGCQLAEFLVERGRKVTILEKGIELGNGLLDHTKKLLLPWLQKNGVTMMTGVEHQEITDKGITIITSQGETLTIKADNIIPITPLSPNSKLFNIFKGKAPEVYAIGDAREPHLIVDAIADGSNIARKI